MLLCVCVLCAVLPFRQKYRLGHPGKCLLPVQIDMAAPHLYVINADALAIIYPKVDLKKLSYLSMCDSSIRRMEGLSCVRAITSLSLAFNELLKIEGLEGLVHLGELNLAHNHIQRVEGLRGLTALTSMDLSHNNLAHIEDINLLRCVSLISQHGAEQRIQFQRN